MSPEQYAAYGVVESAEKALSVAREEFLRKYGWEYATDQTCFWLWKKMVKDQRYTAITGADAIRLQLRLWDLGLENK